MGRSVENNTRFAKRELVGAPCGRCRSERCQLGENGSDPWRTIEVLPPHPIDLLIRDSPKETLNVNGNQHRSAPKCMRTLSKIVLPGTPPQR